MMGKTHVAVGVLVALLVFQPITIAACAATIAGGALGGSAADIDAIKTDHNHDALLGQLIPVGITGAMLLVEHFLGKALRVLCRIRTGRPWLQEQLSILCFWPKDMPPGIEPLRIRF